MRSWQNNISFCAGAGDQCVSRGGGAGIKTVANASLSSPGVITHSYDSALSPQIGEYTPVDTTVVISDPQVISSMDNND